MIWALRGSAGWRRKLLATLRCGGCENADDLKSEAVRLGDDERLETKVKVREG